MRSDHSDFITEFAIEPVVMPPLRSGFYRDWVKPGVDLLLAILALPVILPVIVILCLLVKRDGGPCFFGHTRIGHNGRKFKCWKIRTMIVDSQAVLKRHLAENPEAAAEWQRDFKLTNDPRVTRLGAFLRASSLDELPQIWNVLKGEMSFVGPRPVTDEELSRYQGHEWCYLTLRPGITGLWQVSGRNDVDYASRVRLDATYAGRMSLLGDLSIIAKTANAVLKRTGK